MDGLTPRWVEKAISGRGLNRKNGMTEKFGKILVVDDEAPICDLVEEFLSYEGYAVISATNGGDGLAKFRVEQPDLVLLDIRMPGMSGLEVLQTMKGIRPDAPVIVLSAFGDSETIQKALALGAMRYIEKPMELKALLGAIKGLERDWEAI